MKETVSGATRNNFTSFNLTVLVVACLPPPPIFSCKYYFPVLALAHLLQYSSASFSLLSLVDFVHSIHLSDSLLQDTDWTSSSPHYKRFHCHTLTSHSPLSFIPCLLCILCTVSAYLPSPPILLPPITLSRSSRSMALAILLSRPEGRWVRTRNCFFCFKLHFQVARC